MIVSHDNFPSKFVTSRNIEVWLPPNYGQGEKFAVLYMHDGQMLFDPTCTWNGQTWNADSTAALLMETGKIKNCIIVGIWNGGETRHEDYFPEKPFLSLDQDEKNQVQKNLEEIGRISWEFQPRSDAYLRCIVEEIKPFIENNYNVKKDKANTFIAGSSMGGLISLYALMEYPHIFGGAACISTHWPGIFSMENNPVPDKFFEYISSKIPELDHHILYFDYGDQTLDSLYPPLQKKVDEVLQDYDSAYWTSRFFPGEDHSERAWSKRFEQVLLYLLNKS